MAAEQVRGDAPGLGNAETPPGEYITHGDRFTCYTFQRPRD
ncbi:hypothetical protein [Streptomyces sp. UNOC14_S4]|nr:hypothetical protein [Streptomyces sp. UNOC14_S4]